MPKSLKIRGITIERQFEEVFENERAAGQCGDSWHGQLVGNDDYENNRILLNVSGCIVTLTQFSDSKTNVDFEKYPEKLVLKSIESAKYRIISSDHEYFNTREQALDFINENSHMLGEDYKNGNVRFMIELEKDNVVLWMDVLNDSSIMAMFGYDNGPTLMVYGRN